MNFKSSADGRFQGGGLSCRCALGRSGVIGAKDKREGDGASPVGMWPIRRVLYRPDRGPAPKTALPVQSIAPDDGWCDAPGDAAYNQPVKRPYAASHEALWREDGVYDVIVVLGYNDDPVIPGKGSAIFLHLARQNYEPTEGCVALASEDMARFLVAARVGDTVEIVAD